MRRLLALGCCAAYLAFGFTAGVAHVHDAADHHDEMRGLHLDHDHLGEVADHGPTGHRHPASPGAGEAHLGTRHIDHHERDALYLNVTAQCLVDSGLRVAPAVLVVAATTDSAIAVSGLRSERQGPQRGPPGADPTPSRAPPA